MIKTKQKVKKVKCYRIRYKIMKHEARESKGVLCSTVVIKKRIKKKKNVKGSDIK